MPFAPALSARQRALAARVVRARGSITSGGAARVSIAYFLWAEWRSGLRHDGHDETEVLEARHAQSATEPQA
jgi:hypothetical protein